jgi:hypothetical protein
MTHRYLGVAILLSIACRADRTVDRAHNGAADIIKERAMPNVQKVAWRELRWNDNNMAWLRDGPRVRLVLRDSDTFARTWRQVTGDSTQPPSVDFRNVLVLLLAAPSQTRGGYGIVVDSVFVRPESDTVNVSVREISPGPHCTLPNDGSRPILAGTIPITTSTIRFLERQSESDCTP